ncbi:MAG: ATP synthase F1 subunit epsilon [Prevotella sp.]|nr:ATP synthase F1 subunit epsilon [Prevotella sp.]
MSLKLKIVTPEKIVYDGDIVSVRVPGALGQFEVLENHAPIISALEKGIVEYVTTGGSNRISVSGGFVEVQKNVVSLCVELQ